MKGTISLRIIHSGPQQHVSQPRSFPSAIHDRAIHPVDTLHLLEEGAHRVSAVTSTLERTCQLMLGKAGPEVVD